MNSRQSYMSILAASLLTFALCACSDDNPNEPPKVKSIDTVRIDSINTMTICPPRTVIVFAKQLPTESADLKVRVGGRPAAVNILGADQFELIIPGTSKMASSRFSMKMRLFAPSLKQK